MKICKKLISLFLACFATLAVSSCGNNEKAQKYETAYGKISSQIPNYNMRSLIKEINLGIDEDGRYYATRDENKITFEYDRASKEDYFKFTVPSKYSENFDFEFYAPISSVDFRVNGTFDNTYNIEKTKASDLNIKQFIGDETYKDAVSQLVLLALKYTFTVSQTLFPYGVYISDLGFENYRYPFAHFSSVQLKFFDVSPVPNLNGYQLYWNYSIKNDSTIAGKACIRVAFYDGSGNEIGTAQDITENVIKRGEIFTSEPIKEFVTNCSTPVSIKLVDLDNHGHIYQNY